MRIRENVWKGLGAQKLKKKNVANFTFSMLKQIGQMFPSETVYHIAHGLEESFS